jgi:hypothetical protein
MISGVRTDLLEECSGQIVNLRLDRPSPFLGNVSLALSVEETGRQSLHLELHVGLLDEEASAARKRQSSALGTGD